MKNARILIVDDENDLLSALDAAFSAAGFSVFLAKDGIEGLGIALREKPDLILLDIRMPKMNGHKMLQELRKDPWGKMVKVLLLTNADDPTNITRGIELQSNDYLIKSQVSLEELVKQVKQHLAGYHD
jgi:DNA-binding response OmpR family regulator